MSAVLSNKEKVALLKSLEAQGAKVTKTKSGARITFPNKTSMTIHWTESDARATLNIRARVRRAGFTWPFDDAGAGKSLKGTALSPERVEKLNEKITEMGFGPFPVAEVARQSGVSEPTARKYLLARGYTQKKRGSWTYEEPDAYPEIEKAKTLKIVAPAPLLAPAPHKEPREFLDSEDSWTVEVPADLKANADQMGLHIEVRVWRSEK